MIHPCFLSVTDVCAASGLTCEYTCDNSTGTFVCICPNGYELEPNKRDCTGINQTSYETFWHLKRKIKSLPPTPILSNFNQVSPFTCQCSILSQAKPEM